MAWKRTELERPGGQDEQLYKGAFYSSRREMTLAAARRILGIVGRLVEVGSAVDLGAAQPGGPPPSSGASVRGLA